MSFLRASVPLIALLFTLPTKAESLFITNNCPDDHRTCAKVRLGDSDRADTWARILTETTSPEAQTGDWNTQDRVFGFQCTANAAYDTERVCEFFFRSSASPVLATVESTRNLVQVATGRIEAIIDNPSDVAELNQRLASRGGRMTAHSLATEGGTDRVLSLQCTASRCTVSYQDPSILAPHSLVNFRRWPEIR